MPSALKALPGRGLGANLYPSQHHDPHKEYELAQQQNPHLSRRHLVPVHSISLQSRHEHEVFSLPSTSLVTRAALQRQDLKDSSSKPCWLHSSLSSGHKVESASCLSCGHACLMIVCQYSVITSEKIDIYLHYLRHDCMTHIWTKQCKGSHARGHVCTCSSKLQQ